MTHAALARTGRHFVHSRLHGIHLRVVSAFRTNDPTDCGSKCIFLESELRRKWHAGWGKEGGGGGCGEWIEISASYVRLDDMCDPYIHIIYIISNGLCVCFSE